MTTTPLPVTDLTFIQQNGVAKTSENDAFSLFLSKQPSDEIDKMVFELNHTVSNQVNCTDCGNCCRSLMISVSDEEITALSKVLAIPENETKSKYIESGASGNHHILNTIPCHFLHDNKCTIYENRFNDCSAFPHLDQPNFTSRIFSNMMYYGICPIIYNVVEQLKQKLHFSFSQ